MMNGILQDLRYAVRQLRKSLGFTAVAVVTLALGIGANTAIFSVVDGVLLRPLPYPDSARLVTIHGSFATLERPYTAISYPEFKDILAQSRTLANVAAYEESDANLSGTGGRPEPITAGVASATLLPTLDVHPILGRNFVPEEELRGGDQVALIDYSLWQSRFASAADVVGRALVIDNLAYRIVGVLPRGF